MTLVYKYNFLTHRMEQMWQHPISDMLGQTGMTVFDFNQDGNMEIVYRDETHLRIIDGATGDNITTINSRACSGCIRYPIVVDLDKDGSAEIVVSEDYPEDYSFIPRIRSFKNPTGQPWAPARSVWNQYAYNVVHINEDLTVPQYQFNPVTPFTNPTTGTVRRPFNHFLQQVGPINQYGEPFVPTTDVTFIEDSTIVRYSCDSIEYMLFIRNQGNTKLDLSSVPLEIAIYKDYYGGPPLGVILCTVEIEPNEYISIPLSILSEFDDFLPITNLVFVLNDGGFGIGQNGHWMDECDTNNNILVIPVPIANRDTFFSASICQKEPFVDYGFNLPADSTTEVGVFHFYQHLTSVQGCDSIVNLELTVHPAYTTELNAQACNHYELSDTTYTESGEYLKTLNTVTGCDSVIKLYLTILDEYNIKFTAVACQSFTWNGQTYTASGEYVKHFTSAQGCDSIVQLDLTILPNSSVMFEDTIVMGEAYNQYGFDIPVKENYGIYTYQQMLKNQWGCDSIVKLILHVLPPIVDRSVELEFPNAFTPDKEPNNYFSVAHKRDVKDLKISIYNRWGEMVFQSSDINLKWNGKDLKGNPVPVGSYIYLVEYHLQSDPNITRQKTGNVNVIY